MQKVESPFGPVTYKIIGDSEESEIKAAEMLEVKFYFFSHYVYAFGVSDFGNDLIEARQRIEKQFNVSITVSPDPEE